MDTSLETKAMDEERKSLETLFTARFNAYLVPVGLFSVAATSSTLAPRAQAFFLALRSDRILDNVFVLLIANTRNRDDCN
jgi:hypothetical protein